MVSDTTVTGYTDNYMASVESSIFFLCKILSNFFEEMSNKMFSAAVEVK